MKLRIFSLFLAFVMLLSFAACANTGTEGEQSTEGSTQQSPESTPVDISVYTLNGTTGFGMAKMMNDAKNGAYPSENYTFSIKKDASDVTAALINGDADIAALPTNAAANVYNKTNGGVQILALNTLGVLYLLTTDGSTVSSFADLQGKTVYVPAQNPAFIFRYLCEQNGLTVGTDIIIDTTSYAKPEDLKDVVASGAVAIAVLPEPMVTIATNAAKANNVTVNNTMDLTAEWDKVTTPGTLVQGCVVVRTEFLNAHPTAVENFLMAYEASVTYLGTNVADAAQMIVDNGIFSSVPVAKAAIPKCNVCYIEGTEVKTRMNHYLNILWNIAPASIGNAIPSDTFYYNAQ